MQLVHPWRSSAVINGRMLTATRTHCIASEFFPLPSPCSISDKFKTAFVIEFVNYLDWLKLVRVLIEIGFGI